MIKSCTGRAMQKAPKAQPCARRRAQGLRSCSRDTGGKSVSWVKNYVCDRLDERFGDPVHYGFRELRTCLTTSDANLSCGCPPSQRVRHTVTRFPGSLLSSPREKPMRLSEILLTWLLLGPGIGQCQELGGIDPCTGRGDKLSRAGMTLVFVGSLALISTLPIYGVRVKQEKKLERLTLDYVTYGGRIAPSAPFEEYRLADAKDRSRRARNALIGSAVTLGLGSMFIGFAVPRCEMGDGRLLCTDPGYFHFTAGLTLGGAGALGVIVSGVLLHARNQKKKSLARSVRQRQGFGLRWNPTLGAFVF